MRCGILYDLEGLVVDGLRLRLNGLWTVGDGFWTGYRRFPPRSTFTSVRKDFLRSEEVTGFALRGEVTVFAPRREVTVGLQG